MRKFGTLTDGTRGAARRARRSRSRAWGGASARAAAWLLALLAASCYEIPPRIPPGFVGGKPEAPGWPAPAAYDLDRSHPLNRWFQRAFAPRDARGDILPVSGSEPLPLARELAPVDRAEQLALLEAAFGEVGGEVGAQGGAERAGADRGSGAVRAAVLASDLLQAALAAASGPLDADGARELGAKLAEASRAVSLRHRLREEGTLDAEEPPPLREGGWFEIPPPDVQDLAPSAADLRWTRVAFRGDSPAEGSAFVLLRLRVALDGLGEPLLLALPSECFEVLLAPGSAGEARVRTWRFDRERCLRGEDPWVASERDEGWESSAVEVFAKTLGLPSSRLARAAFGDPDLNRGRDARESARTEGGSADSEAGGAPPIRPYAREGGGPWKVAQRARISEVLDAALWAFLGRAARS